MTYNISVRLKPDRYEQSPRCYRYLRINVLRGRSVCRDWTSLPIFDKAAMGEELDEEVI